MEFDTFEKVYPEVVEEVERETDLRVEEAFDEFRQEEFPPELSENVVDRGRAKTVADNNTVRLEYSGDLTAWELAHDTVHGQMLQSGGPGEILPGDNLFDMKLYGEFAANLAEVEVRDPGPDPGSVMSLVPIRSHYMDRRREAVDNGFETRGSLYDEFLAADAEGREEFREAILDYQDIRENVVAQQAAREYARENDYELEDYLEPDRQLFHDTVDYVKNFEGELIDRAKPDGA
ncbi:MAG: hypothetical protein ABEJ75_00745 [Candidatus Nanohaloarchaea archaeon]